MPVRTVVFDFDQTLSVAHVFNFLAVETPPLATTERGQLARITELDQTQQFRSQGGFATAMMGGASRIAQLSDMLSLLRSSRVECMVCTRGLVGPVRKILHQIGLLSYFSGTYGNTGETYGHCDYDLTADPGQDICFIGGPECQIPASKQEFVQTYMIQRRLSFDDVLFIDDTMSEITMMEDTCQTIHVASKGGMGPELFEEICQRAAEPQRGQGVVIDEDDSEDEDEEEGWLEQFQRFFGQG